MDLARLLLFAGTHTLVAAVAAIIAMLGRQRSAATIAAVSLVAVGAVAIVASWASPEIPLLVSMLRARSGSSLVSLCLGVSTAVPWLLLAFPSRGSSQPWYGRGLPVVLCCSLVCLLGCVGAVWYRDSSPQSPKRGVSASSFDSRFVVEEIANFAESPKVWENGTYPICVAVDEKDNVFISLQLKGQEEYSGKIVQVMDDASFKATVRLKTVAESSCLFHTFGLAARNGQIFVSRSGFLARAKDGHIEYENAGAITRLRDLDRDGVMDYYEDVVTGLPGSQGPTTQHSNNAITFGPDGSLYIAQGVHSDRGVVDHPWEGKILRASPDFKTVSVFASGLRNPFGLAFGPDERLFATDNDVAIGNPGDELNLIEEGADYGHPYVVGDADGGGRFVKPLLLWKKGSFAGMTYSGAASLPDECRDCLYIADFAGNQIVRVVLSRVAAGYAVEAVPFIKVPSPIGIGVTRAGVFYVTSFGGSVFRVREK